MILDSLSLLLNVCTTVCHPTKLLVVLIKSTVSFVRRTMALSSGWLGPVRFYFSVHTPNCSAYTPICNMLHSLFFFFPFPSMLPLICRCESYPTALHYFLYLTSTVHPFPLSFTLKSEILGILYDWSRSFTGCIFQYYPWFVTVLYMF